MGYQDGTSVVPSRPLPPLPPVPQIPSEFASPRIAEPEQENGSPDGRSHSLRRKPLPGSDQPSIVLQAPSAYNGDASSTREVFEDRSARQSGSSLSPSSGGHSRNASREADSPEPGRPRDSGNSILVTKTIPYRQLNTNNVSYNARHSHAAELDSSSKSEQQIPDVYPPLQYHHQPYRDPVPSVSLGEPRERVKSPGSDSQNSSSDHSGIRNPQRPEIQIPRSTIPRPSSAYTLGSDLNARGRTHSPHLSVGGSPSPNGSPISYARGISANRLSPEGRPVSYVDLLNVPYPQQVAPTANLGNSQLRHAVGANASLLDTKKTLEMYRANVKKTQDMIVQYEFALFMVQVAREVMASDPGIDDHGLSPVEMLREARQILQRLADRSYPFAQYYLGDGYASGLFNKGKPDYDRAFPLFVAASKHGHAESGYRAALCYEFGWGCRKDYAKAVQFYRASASKNHPGAATRLGRACLTGDMGLVNRYREGLKWLKRATESADYQYNSAPYELGLLHETGYGDDVFKDEIYAVQLFTQAAELGHPQAALKLGEAYEHGLLCCPKDPALSVHYYNCAAQADIPEAMMNLCAWYMVGAEPVLEKDENEAYEWAKKAAEHGLPKAEYACGYFTEMGIGCRRDPLEANVWYVKAADHGDELAKQRLAIIRAAASGDAEIPLNSEKSKGKKGSKDDKDCIVM
ncbi:HCP-like protein [Lepidopterella palustris CBS 459.81]|uniref:HCP-like protein n=1 Tax=Lepidopterella palustris CBS 459.81 TaxID=1314670 RepID=A0A8E2DXE8_9PEZI|nr:HCP-like protein [Lepidopterella palustris CBS 459.81]